MNGVKIKNDLAGDTRRGFELTPWGYITIGLAMMLFGVVVGAGGENADAAVFIVAIASVPLSIGVIAEGVRIGNRS